MRRLKQMLVDEWWVFALAAFAVVIWTMWQGSNWSAVILGSVVLLVWIVSRRNAMRLGLISIIVGALVLLYGWYALKVTYAIGFSGNTDQRPEIYLIIGVGIVLILVGIVSILVGWRRNPR